MMPKLTVNYKNRLNAKVLSNFLSFYFYGPGCYSVTRHEGAHMSISLPFPFPKIKFKMTRVKLNLRGWGPVAGGSPTILKSVSLN